MTHDWEFMKVIVSAVGASKQWCSVWLLAGVKSGQSFLASSTGHKGFKITADLIGMC